MSWSLPLFRFLALRGLRRHPVRALLALLAVAAGVSMAVSVVVVRSSVERSVEEFGRELAGPTDLRIVGAVRRGALGPEVVGRVAATEGVDSVVPLVQAVTVAGPNGDDPFDSARPVVALGVDCRAESLLGSVGCRDAAVADGGDQPLARGRGVSEDEVVRTALGEVSLRGVPTLDGVDGLADGRFVVFALPTAQRLFDRGDGFDVIYIAAGPGGGAPEQLKATLQEVVGTHNGVLDATQGPPEVVAALADVLPLFTLLALLALGTGVMLVHNTVTLAVERRRGELAVVGALGSPRWVIAAITFGETALLGLIGGLAGVVGGWLVAGPLVAGLSTYTERVAGIPLAVHAGPSLLVLGALGGLAVAVVATIPGARRAVRVDVAAELADRGRYRDGSTPRLLRRAVGWGIIAAVGLLATWLAQRRGGLSPWQYPVGGLGFGVASVAMLLLGAALAPWVIRLLRRAMGWTAAGRLACANLTGMAGRTGVMVAALGAAACVAFVTSGFSKGLESSWGDAIEADMAGVQVSAVGPGANINMDAGIPPAAVAALEEIEGVARTYRGTAVLSGSEFGDIVLVTAGQRPWAEEDARVPVRGRLDREGFAQGEALINTALARSRGLRPGDLVSLPTPNGMVELPIQAVVHGGGPGDGRVAISYDTHVALYGHQPVRSVYAEAAPGVDYDELAERVRAADLGIELRVETPAGVVADARRSVARQMAPFWTLQRGLLAVAFVAVLSTLLLVGMQRQRELATVAAAGASPGTLVRMVLLEAAIVALVAGALAALAGSVLLWGMTMLSPLTIGSPVPFTPDWLAVLPATAMALLVALPAAAWPAWRASRADIIAALSSE